MRFTRRRFVASSSLLASTAAGQFVFPLGARAACITPVSASNRIQTIDVETWTGSGEYDRTGDSVQCRIYFADGSHIAKVLNNPGVNDRELGQRDRFRLNLTDIPTQVAISGQTPGTIRALEILKTSGDNFWKCEAVGLRVNDVVVLSRYVTNGGLHNIGDKFRVDRRNDSGLDGIEIRIRTANSPYGGTDDSVYVNVVFQDGTLLYPNENLYLNVGPHLNDWERNNAISNYAYLLPLPASGDIKRVATDIEHFYIRKEGTNGWLLRSARLYADGRSNFVVGNTSINQFLDNSADVLRHRDWSTRSIAEPVSTSAHLPLPGSTKYAISGPVLGHVGSNVAKIVYRVEREGRYRVTLQRTDAAESHTRELQLCPTGTFTFSGLTPDKEYRFEFFYLPSSGPAQPMTEGNGALHTRPADGTPVRFSFVAGSCARNGYDEEQRVWDLIAATTKGKEPTRFFVHLGDCTYFFDDVSETPASDESTLAAGYFAPRKHPGFLRMARLLPCYAVWDDHDFRYNNAEAAGYALKGIALKQFKEYWGNSDPLANAYGLTTRFSYGNVDFYLMDGRYNRNQAVGAYFGTAQCNAILSDIRTRGSRKMRILMSGSLWNNLKKDNDDKKKTAYGNDVYDLERTIFFQGLANLIPNTIQGLIFLSGDIHKNEIYEVSLPAGGSKVAPEFACSPLTENSGGGTRPIHSERKWIGGNREPSYAVIEVDTISSPWTVKVQYRKVEDNSAMCTQSYSLSNNQFAFTPGACLVP